LREQRQDQRVFLGMAQSGKVGRYDHPVVRIDSPVTVSSEWWHTPNRNSGVRPRGDQQDSGTPGEQLRELPSGLARSQLDQRHWPSSLIEACEAKLSLSPRTAGLDLARTCTDCSAVGCRLLRPPGPSRPRTSAVVEVFNMLSRRTGAQARMPCQAELNRIGPPISGYRPVVGSVSISNRAGSPLHPPRAHSITSGGDDKLIFFSSFS